MATAKYRYQQFFKRLVTWKSTTSPWLMTFFSFLFILIYIHPSPVQAAEETVLTLTPQKAIRGQKVTIRIRTTIPWRNSVHIEKPELSRIMAWWALPYARPWRTINENGEEIALIEVLSAIQIDSPGFHSIAPFRIKSGQWEAETAETDIICVNPDEKDFPFPIFAGWQTATEEFWQGQSVLIVLEAKNLAFLAMADSVSLNNVPVGILEETPNSGQITTRYNTDTVIYDVPMATWLWTVTAPGKYIFPGAKLIVHGIKRSIQGFSVQVKSLPEECRNSGAVGSFSVSADWENRTYRAGELLSISLSIQGEGNLKVLTPPTPVLSDTELVKSTPSASYKTGKNGYTGIRTTRYEYRILDSAVKSGNLVLNIPEWTYLKPVGVGQVHSIVAQSHRIDVEAAMASESEKTGHKLLGADMFKYKATVFNTGKLWPYLFILPGVMFFIILFFIRRKSFLHILPTVMIIPFLLSATAQYESDAEAAATAKQLALEEQWEDAIDIYNELTSQYGELPGLLHDRAIVESETGHPGIAVTLMRRAMHLKPGNGKFIQSLQFIENKLNLKEQVPPSLLWPPSLPFIFCIIGINMLFLTLTWIYIIRKVRNFSLLVSTIIFLLATIGGVVYTRVIWDRPVSVVAWIDQPLKRIPDPLAEDWVTLSAGTSVHVKAFEGVNCLVQTGFGLEGWLPIDALNVISEMNYGF